EADDAVPSLQQMTSQMAGDEADRAGDQDRLAHGSLLPGVSAATKPAVARSVLESLDAPRGTDKARAMDDSQFKALLEAAQVEKEGEWSVLTGEKTLTLHVSSGGVGL